MAHIRVFRSIVAESEPRLSLTVIYLVISRLYRNDLIFFEAERL
jgi:hypothetical protein